MTAASADVEYEYAGCSCGPNPHIWTCPQTPVPEDGEPK